MSKLSADEQKLRDEIERAIDVLVVHGLVRRLRTRRLELTGFGQDWPAILEGLGDKPIPGLGLISSPDPLCPVCKQHRSFCGHNL